MITVNDVTVIVYPENQTENSIVKPFVELHNAVKIPFSDEHHLGKILEDLQKEGYESKEVIILKEFHGRTFQKCPGSKNVICCNYRLMNTCFDCLYNCAYCYLNSYLNSYGIVQFINLDEVIDEMSAGLPGNDLIYRVGTGEYTDSLMMDEVTGLAHDMIAKTKNMKNVMLEFKTKSSCVDHLLDIPEKGNTVLAWSLNTERNVRLFEEGAANLDERLDAAAKASKAGFYTAFHFDPVIFYPDCLDEFSEVIDRLFSMVDHESIVWISMGGFRYSPGFKEIIQDKFPDETMTTEEMFPGIDGKYRYLKPLRLRIYSHLLEKIRSYSEKPFVYMCMETTEVWEKVFNMNYKTSGELEIDFSNHLKRHFFAS